MSDLKNTYWQKNGLYQKEMKKLQKQDASDDYIYLFIVMENLYKTYHQYELVTWQGIVERRGYDLKYVPPADIPANIRQFFARAKSDVELAIKINKNIGSKTAEADYKKLTIKPDEIESIFDSVIDFVTKKYFKKTEKKKAEPKKKSPSPSKKTDYASMTLPVLKKLASDKKIKGRSKMNKAELVSALSSGNA